MMFNCWEKYDLENGISTSNLSKQTDGPDILAFD